MKIQPLIPMQSWWDDHSADPVEDQILTALLQSRQMEIKELTPSLKEIPDPFLLLNLRESLELFWEIWTSGKKVLLLGDYDVDGITSTALMMRFFKFLGEGQVDFLLPNRLIHGYGLTVKTVEEIKKREPALVITLDNGIVAGPEVKLLQDEGIQVIITDHHMPQEGLTPDCLVINPKQENCSFPEKNPSGVGVAFLWLLGLRSYLRDRNFWQGHEPNLLEQLDLVALGTIADQVPLVGINRIFAKFGLEQMTARLHAPDAGPGFYYLRAFGDRMKLTSFDPRVLAFRLAPLLNATGRIGEASQGLKFILSGELTAARNQLKKLEKTNNSRKNMQDKMVKWAKDLADKDPKEGGLVIYHPEFHEGLVGIIAHRLLDQFGLPTAVLTMGEGGMVKGSLRSRGENLMQVLDLCDEHLGQWGGHANAAGVNLHEKDLPNFMVSFNRACLQIRGERDVAQLTVDLEVYPQMLSFRLANLLHQLEPFGKEHEQPLFLLKGQHLGEPRVMAEKHLKWELEQDLEIVYWSGVGKLPMEPSLDLAVHLTENEFMGRWRRQLVVQAAVPAGA